MKSIKIGPEARNYFYDLLLTQNLRLRFILLSCDYGWYSIPNKIDNSSVKNGFILILLR